jgi:hypothetical protein
MNDSVSNTLVYYCNELITTEESFIVQAPVIDIINLFYLSSKIWKNKHLFSRQKHFKPSLIFESKTGRGPS